MTRLEEIKHCVKIGEESHPLDIVLTDLDWNDINWLISQAQQLEEAQERMGKLEKVLERCKKLLEQYSLVSPLSGTVLTSLKQDIIKDINETRQLSAKGPKS